jgi:hypothetical protein
VTKQLQLGEPVWTLVRQYSDLSGILGAFGPFDSEDAAKAAIPELERIGLDTGSWTAVATWPVRDAAAVTG